MIAYGQEELNLILAQRADRASLRDIADACNEGFHGGRRVRTARGIEYALLGKLKTAKKQFRRTCDVCGEGFATSWPQARYCGAACRAVVDREAAVITYHADPAKNVQAQTVRARARMESRWKTILARFGDRCGRCGHSFPRVAYDLHHPKGKSSRKETPARIIRNGTEEQFARLLSETILLCAVCHRLEHAETGNWGPAHEREMANV